MDTTRKGGGGFLRTGLAKKRILVTDVAQKGPKGGSWELFSCRHDQLLV